MSKSETETSAPTSDAKLVWETPEVTRILAGEAELGATPIVAEGAFGRGKLKPRDGYLLSKAGGLALSGSRNVGLRDASSGTQLLGRAIFRPA